MSPAGRHRPGSEEPALKSFTIYLTEYFRNISRRAFLLTTTFVALLIFLNYTIGIEPRIRALQPWPLSLLVFFAFYTLVFFSAWGIQYFCGRTHRPLPALYIAPGFPVHSRTPAGHSHFPANAGWWTLLLLAPLFFASKMIHWDLSFLIPAAWHDPWRHYTLVILQLPAKLLLLVLLLAACKKMLEHGPDGLFQMLHPGPDNSFFGLTCKGFAPRPYLMILLFLTPVIALASTQHDFLLAYPKIRNIAFISGYAQPAWPWKLLYEISYGLDFLSIELFFRGFLVIGLARWAGGAAILPMAAFYCTVHFGKPLGECITSFFGGLALGVIAWRTRSILGGLIVHLGIAWMMEVGGWIGNM
jgi:hypothetical protein